MSVILSLVLKALFFVLWCVLRQLRFSDSVGDLLLGCHSVRSDMIPLGSKRGLTRKIVKKSKTHLNSVRTKTQLFPKPKNLVINNCSNDTGAENGTVFLSSVRFFHSYNGSIIDHFFARNTTFPRLYYPSTITHLAIHFWSG